MTENIARKFKGKKGFTLVELLLSVSLLALVVGLSADIIISLVRSNTKAQVVSEIEQESNFVFLKLQNDIKNAERAEVPSGNTLIITRRDPERTVVTYRAVISSDAPYLSWQRGSGSEMPLTDISTDVNGNPRGVAIECNPTCFTANGGGATPYPTSITIQLRLYQAGTSNSAIFSSDVEIEDTFTVRGNY